MTREIRGITQEDLLREKLTSLESYLVVYLNYIHTITYALRFIRFVKDLANSVCVCARARVYYLCIKGGLVENGR